jgi:hypothetical protein
MLPADTLAQQRAGGTWSELFDYDWIQNRYPVWDCSSGISSSSFWDWPSIPLIRLAMPGLADKGYPLSRALGLVLLGYLRGWRLDRHSLYAHDDRHCLRASFSRRGACLLQRDELREEWQDETQILPD